MTRKSLWFHIIRQMQIVLLASGGRLFRSRLYITSSWHSLKEVCQMVLHCSSVRDWSILDFQLQVADVMKERKYSAVKQPQALMKCGTLIYQLWNYIIPVDLRFQIKDLTEDKRQSLPWNVCLLHTSPVAGFLFTQLSLGSIFFLKKN